MPDPRRLRLVLLVMVVVLPLAFGWFDGRTGTLIGIALAVTAGMALAVREHGLPTKVVALEHNPEWADHTRRMLERHGVAEFAEVRVATLAPTSLDDHSTPWYDESTVADLTEIGLVLVDSPRARYPIVPLLRDKLAERCTILVDDTDRPGDADVVERRRPFLPDFEFDVLHLDKGAAVLTRK